MSMSAKPTQETVPDRGPEPAFRTRSNKKRKYSPCTGSEPWTLPTFFNRHPREWGFRAYSEDDRGDFPSHQVLDGWRESLEFIVNPHNKQSVQRQNRASQLLADDTQGTDGSDSFIDRPRITNEKSMWTSYLGADTSSIQPGLTTTALNLASPNALPNASQNSPSQRKKSFNTHITVGSGRGTREPERVDEHHEEEIPHPKEAGRDSLPDYFHAEYDKMDKKHKWKLASGRCVENVIYEACRAMGSNAFAYSPAQLFILDTWDPVVEGWFTEDEWDEIMGRVSPLPDVDEILVDSFERFYSVETTAMLREVLDSDLIRDDGIYDKTLHYNLKWADTAILKFLTFLEKPNNPLISTHPEGWYGYNVWSHILDASLHDLPGLTVDRKEGTCRATAMRINGPRKTVTQRLKHGPRYDGIIRGLGDDDHEYGGIEDGRSFAGGVKATKWMNDNIKLIKSLYDMLYRLDDLVDGDPAIRLRMQVVGISTAGLAMQYAHLGHPGIGYVCLLQRGPIMHVPKTIELLPDLLRMLVIVAQLKELIRESFEAVQKRLLVQSKESFRHWLVGGNAARRGPKLPWPGPDL
ncbi:hypothetical protein HOY82DRAFT_615379 [Tuber indicum]|nr:hypothetical protein HOY82DRAFT_615379 [Tuber indicum]